MTQWVRYRNGTSGEGFGRLIGQEIQPVRGSPWETPEASGAPLPLGSVSLLAPSQPGKLIALWNNFHALAVKLGKAAPAHPLYLIKAATSVIGPGEPIRRPRSYGGKIAYEGELGIVIGRRCSDVTAEEAAAHILGYTCVNDVTAIGVLNENADFAQWCRAKSYDTFGALGPVITTDLDWRSASVVTTLDGVERQRYALADMIFSPQEIVSRLSQDMTLLPGDVIACGTSIGVGSIPVGSAVAVTIEGIGTLANTLTGAPVAALS